MRTLFAPDAFKGSISAVAAARALADGWRDIRPDDETVLVPMADGGEGTLDAIAAAMPAATRVPIVVTGPDDREVAASWLRMPPAPGLPGGTGVVELASTSGIELLRGDLRPLDAHTIGFGQAVAAALDAGVSRLILGIGSSCSTDAGLGLLTALGARALASDGSPVAPGLRGLRDVRRLELAGLRPLPPGGALVITDVTSPLSGVSGAAHVFGAQKGLDAAHVDLADAALDRVSRLTDVDPSTPGAGAAGGTGWALLVWGAVLAGGAAEVAAVSGLPDAVAAADVVVTGEGSYDGQSAAGKVPAHVAALARAAGARPMLAAGRITGDADASAFTSAESLSVLAGSPGAAMTDAARWLRVAGARLAARV